jgi:hypothetical protein
LLKIRNAANNDWVTIGTLASANLGLLSLAGGTLTGALLADDSGTAALPAIAFDGDTNTGIFSPGADQFGIATNGVERVEFGTTEVVFNDGGGDFDFRIEGDTKPNLFKVDAGADTVIIDGLTHPSADGTADQALVTNGSGVLSFASRSRLISGTAVATTSGTSVDFTSIPSWVRKVTVLVDSVSTNGTSLVQMQLGSGSIQTTGYTSVAALAGGSNVSLGVNSLTGIIVAGAGATLVRTAHIVITLQSGNIYLCNHYGGLNDPGVATYSIAGGGSVTLSGVLDRIRLTTVNGTDTFDAGSVNIIYEG